MNLIKYETDHGEVQLSKEIIKRYLVSGDATKVTDQEVTLFIQLCKYQRLNPFLREAYLIKFGNSPATMVTGKDTFVKRAAKSPLCTGFAAGVIVQGADKKIEKRDGSFVLGGEKLVGGWARVHRKDWSVPLEVTASLEEYQQYKKDSDELNRNWKKMPATMIRKVALVQALREAMPEEYEGLYSPEEMNIDDSVLDAEIVETKPEPEAKKISITNAKKLFEIAENDQEMVKNALKTFNYEKTSEVTVENFDKLCRKLEDLKAQKIADAIPDEPD